MNIFILCPLSHFYHLSAIAAPMIVGVDWRLDYSIKSKNAGRENTVMYYVSLKVMDRGVVRDINMIASIEELQDLLSKVLHDKIWFCILKMNGLFAFSCEKLSAILETNC